MWALSYDFCLTERLLVGSQGMATEWQQKSKESRATVFPTALLGVLQGSENYMVDRSSNNTCYLDKLHSALWCYWRVNRASEAPPPPRVFYNTSFQDRRGSEVNFAVGVLFDALAAPSTLHSSAGLSRKGIL